MLSEDASVWLDGTCQARNDYATGDELHEDKQVRRDDAYTVRAWMAVVTYLMTDYKFLYE